MIFKEKAYSIILINFIIYVSDLFFVNHVNIFKNILHKCGIQVMYLMTFSILTFSVVYTYKLIFPLDTSCYLVVSAHCYIVGLSNWMVELTFNKNKIRTCFMCA